MLLKTCFLSRTTFPLRISYKFNHNFRYDNYRNVFHHKSTWEIIRALMVLKMCGCNYLVDNCLQLFQNSRLILGDQVLEWLLKPTIYAQFVGGENEESLLQTAFQLRNIGIRLMVAPTLEEDVGENDDREGLTRYDNNLNQLLSLAKALHTDGGQCPCLQLKITALLSPNILFKLSKSVGPIDISNINLVEKIAKNLTKEPQTLHIPSLNDMENIHFNDGLKRLYLLGNAITTYSLQLLVDAEYSYINPACSLVALAMMATFNQQKPLIGNTYQCYFKSVMTSFLNEMEITRLLGCSFAAKVVRGAYLEKERIIDNQAVCSSYKDTCYLYDSVIDQAIKNIVTGRNSQKNFLIIATHNEDSIKQALKILQNLHLSNSEDNIVFAQIYGISEQISVALANAGCIVYKSVPIGPICQVLPYLARRVVENRSILQGTRKEQELLQQELHLRIQKLFNIG